MRTLDLASYLHLELFAGGGGLALGLRSAGFEDSLLVEADRHACATLRANAGPDSPLGRAEVVEGDVREIQWTGSQIDLLSGGAPCQPFSLGGKRHAQGELETCSLR